jgi:hypothetical protein
LKNASFRIFLPNLFIPIYVYSWSKEYKFDRKVTHLLKPFKDFKRINPVILQDLAHAAYGSSKEQGMPQAALFPS